ncbi:MAG: hypothetical protein NC416_00955 [Eubacterium sp.]|nr:hypothetical protein [Eubacterium sp.]
MREKIFAICDTEEAYALRLTEYLLDKVRLPYTLHLFTRVEELQKFAEQGEIEILLIAEKALKMLKEEYVREQVARLFVLQEDEKNEEDNAVRREEQGHISKFQSPEKIVELLVESISDLSGWRQETAAEDMEVKLIGIYSPVKRCLQTSFALTMGQILAKKHKTLYFNFENYSGFGQMLKREFSMDMTDLMYYYRCARDKLFVRLPSIIQNINGLDYVPPMQYRVEPQEITGRQWLELCRNIAGIGQYEYIILDLDDSMEGLFDLLRNCYKIYTITKDDSFAIAKINQYEQILKFNELEEIADKTVKCRFPVFKELPMNMDLMTHGELAGYVKAIVKEDLYGE